MIDIPEGLRQLSAHKNRPLTVNIISLGANKTDWWRHEFIFDSPRTGLPPLTQPEARRFADHIERVECRRQIVTGQFSPTLIKAMGQVLCPECARCIAIQGHEYSVVCATSPYENIFGPDGILSMVNQAINI